MVHRLEFVPVQIRRHWRFWLCIHFIALFHSDDIEEFSELYGHLSCVVDGGTLGLNDQARLGSTVVDLSHQGFYTIIRPGSAEKDTVAKLEKFGIIEKQQK